MKTHLKTLVFAIATLVAFLACSNSTDDQTQAQPKCKQVGWVLAVAPDDLPEECKSEDKKTFRISEMHWEETDWDYLGGPTSGSMTSGSYDSNTGEVYYTLNGERMSKEEYEIRMEEYWKKYGEQQKGKRNLDIPCVIGDDAVGWTALLTDDEADGLLKKYGELLISAGEPSGGDEGVNAGAGIALAPGEAGCL